MGSKSDVEGRGERENLVRQVLWSRCGKLALAASLGLTRYDSRCWVLVAFQSAGLLMPVFDRLLGFRSNLLKTVSHFYLMNLALLSGFVKFTRGIRSSVWQPIRKNA